MNKKEIPGFKIKAIKVFNRLLKYVETGGIINTNDDKHFLIKLTTVLSFFLFANTLIYVVFKLVMLLLEGGFIFYITIVSVIFILYLIIVIENEQLEVVEKILDKKN